MNNKQRKNMWTGLAMLILLPVLIVWVFRDHYQEIWDNIRAIRTGGVLLLCAWERVQRLACLGLDRLPNTGPWRERKLRWKADLVDLYSQSRRLLFDRARLCRVLAWNSLKLFCLYLTLYLSLRMVGATALSLWRVQLLGGLMHIIVSALPNVAGMGPAELSFWLIFSRYMEYGQLSSALILYRTATFFVPFALSAVLFPIIQRRTAARR